MKKNQLFIVLSFLAFACQTTPPPTENTVSNAAAPASVNAKEDSYLWLEDVTGEKALDWVKAQDEISKQHFKTSPGFEITRTRLLSIFNSNERIPYVSKLGKYYYNFWRDGKNVRGIMRRTTLEEFKKSEPAWETVLDLDELAKSEKENWVWKGYAALYPTYDRWLVYLSRAGADAIVLREFDLESRKFVADGFTLPEAKTRVSWRDRDTIYVGTNFGAGSLTDSGYPRIVKEWKRGTPISEAKTVYEGKKEDVSVSGSVDHDHGRTYEFISRQPTFFTNETLILNAGSWVKVDKPNDAGLETYGDQLLFSLRTDWTVGGKTYPAGALLAADCDRYLKGEREFSVLFEPSARKSLASAVSTKNYLVLNELENVRSKFYVLKFEAGKWSRTPLEAPSFGSTGISAIDSDESDDYFMTHSDFLTPSSLYLGTIGNPEREKLKSLPAFFKSDGLEITQHEVKSKDGTMIPYFQVSAKNLELNGQNPTLLYGYGGFEVTMYPSYSATVGAGWLERGGVYVLANIRGGGEFGPKWHNAARKENRQLAYDDFIAIAEDLIARKVTSSKHLGIQGGSNGGLLMGVMLTQRPDLWKAVLCQVPLLDMKRYHKLLAGASWMDEYGNPDEPKEWGYIQKYSPYQNVKKGQPYPHVLFTTSTRDDRVHPGHARKMVAKMKELGYDVLYYENTEGGHGGAANSEQSAYMWAIGYTFLSEELGLNNPGGQKP